MGTLGGKPHKLLHLTYISEQPEVHAGLPGQQHHSLAEVVTEFLLPVCIPLGEEGGQRSKVSFAYVNKTPVCDKYLGRHH